jgi:hypothetical protein
MFDPPLQSHTHCQAAQANRTSQSLSISVSFPTHGRKKARLHNSVYVAIAGEVVIRSSVHLRNFVLNGKVSASNPLLHIHANRCAAAKKTDT